MEDVFIIKKQEAFLLLVSFASRIEDAFFFGSCSFNPLTFPLLIWVDFVEFPHQMTKNWIP